MYVCLRTRDAEPSVTWCHDEKPSAGSNAETVPAQRPRPSPCSEMKWIIGCKMFAPNCVIGIRKQRRRMRHPSLADTHSIVSGFSFTVMREEKSDASWVEMSSQAASIYKCRLKCGSGRDGGETVMPGSFTGCRCGVGTHDHTCDTPDWDAEGWLEGGWWIHTAPKSFR